MKVTKILTSLLLHGLATAYVEIGCTNRVNVNDANTAAVGLASHCGTNVMSPHSKMSETAGNTRVYCCNYGGQNSCSTAELQAAWTAIQIKCGNGVGGYWYQSDWKKTYGFDTVAASFCGNM